MANVNLLIFPEVAEDQEEATVKENLIKMLKVDKAKVEEWFLAEEPTILLQNVAEEVAGKYEKAITQCGAQCVIQDSGDESLSLVPKLKNKNTRLFICPSCEHEMDIGREEEVDQCPECGLVMAKWEERMREEAEKEKIRRRLLRDQRLKDDGAAEKQARMDELERLRALEREIMKELGIKPPSKLWMIFENNPLSISFAMTCLIMMATGVAFFYVDSYIDQQEQLALEAAAPGSEIEQVAPMLGTAVQMEASGNGQVMSEVANVTQVMQGQGSETRQAAIDAAQQMMKGVDPEKFLAVAANMAPMPTMSQAAPGGKPQPVNTDTIGGVTGMEGAPNFDMETLAAIAPPPVVDGRDRVLNVLADKRIIDDPSNPDGPGIVLEAIDEMDGSQIVDLMGELKADLEWDLYLAEHVRDYMTALEFEKAIEVAGEIVNPVMKISVLSEIMADFQLDGKETDVKLQMASVRLDLANVNNKDLEAALILDIGRKLGEAGSRVEPQSSFARVEEIASVVSNQKDRASILGRLAVAHFLSGDKRRTREYFGKATQAAGMITEPGERMVAFSRLAMRYYDVRNTTLANEILAEADVIAATRLDPAVRSRVFAELAIARAYLGDLPGARLAVQNAAQDRAREQVYAKLAQALMDNGRMYAAMEIMESVSDPVERIRLENRFLAYLMHSGKKVEARDRMQRVLVLAREVTDAGDRGIHLSRLARLAVRLGDEDLGESIFRESLDASDILDGRKEQLNRGIVALEMGRVFWFARANDIVGRLDDIVVRDPIGNEIIATERVVNHLLPEGLIEYEEE